MNRILVAIVALVIWTRLAFAAGWRWRLTAANGRIICQGEAHTRKPDAVRACRTVANTAFAARVVA